MSFWKNSVLYDYEFVLLLSFRAMVCIVCNTSGCICLSRIWLIWCMLMRNQTSMIASYGNWINFKCKCKLTEFLVACHEACFHCRVFYENGLSLIQWLEYAVFMIFANNLCMEFAVASKMSVGTLIIVHSGNTFIFIMGLN